MASIEFLVDGFTISLAKDGSLGKVRTTVVTAIGESLEAVRSAESRASQDAQSVREYPVRQ